MDGEEAYVVFDPSLWLKSFLKSDKLERKRENAFLPSLHSQTSLKVPQQRETARRKEWTHNFDN